MATPFANENVTITKLLSDVFQLISWHCYSDRIPNDMAVIKEKDRFS
jgi:hypothetical protein